MEDIRASAGRLGRGVKGLDRCVDIRTTLDDLELAERMARAVVEARVAACSHVTSPVTAFYWWEDELQRTVEWEVVVRTPPDLVDDAIDMMLSIHPYGLPGLAVSECVPTPEYGDWIVETTLES